MDDKLLALKVTGCSSCICFHHRKYRKNSLMRECGCSHPKGTGSGIWYATIEDMRFSFHPNCPLKKLEEIRCGICDHHRVNHETKTCCCDLTILPRKSWSLQEYYATKDYVNIDCPLIRMRKKLLCLPY